MNTNKHVDADHSFQFEKGKFTCELAFIYECTMSDIGGEGYERLLASLYLASLSTCWYNVHLKIIYQQMKLFYEDNIPSIRNSVMDLYENSVPTTICKRYFLEETVTIY